MKNPRFLFIGLWALLPMFTISTAAGKTRINSTDAVIETHLASFRIAFPEHHRPRIKRLIARQLREGQHETAITLGRAAFFFPIFEHYLAEFELPDELKYLPFVESRLRIYAESPAGARGLWQLMDYTARQYGLRVNEQVDERLDPMRSTEAAIKLLHELHAMFEDWLLALAAYNCGPGRVQAAIRRAKSKDYWKVEPYLPQQTQRYIPAFIAAIYVAEYAERHGLRAKPHRFSAEDVRVLRVYCSIHLQQMAQSAHLSLGTLKRLNPGYQQEVIPANRRGHYLILPDSVFSEVTTMLKTNAINFEAVTLQVPQKSLSIAAPNAIVAAEGPAQLETRSLRKLIAFIFQPFSRLLFQV